MVDRKRTKRRIMFGALAIIPLGLATAFVFASLQTKIVAYFLAAWIYQSTFAPWIIVEVPLPEELGTLKFHRKHDGMFQGSYYRRVEIRGGSGRYIVSSDLMVNNGGTMMFLHWQPADLNGGPYLWLQEQSGVTFVNLGEPCLGDSFKPTYAISTWIQCREIDYPVSYNWQYFGRIVPVDLGLKFLVEETWPPDVESKYVFASEWIPLPGTDWIFQVDHRPDPRGSGHPRYWIALTGPEGARITAWFKDDYQTSWCCTPDPATLFWYPATESRGPYLRVGRFEGYGYGASTLIDLAARRAYRAFRTSGMTLNHEIEGRVVTGMASTEDIRSDYAVLYQSAGHFMLRPYSVDKQRLPPLPDAVRNVTPRAIGTIDLKTLTFSPEVITPVYLE